MAVQFRTLPLRAAKPLGLSSPQPVPPPAPVFSAEAKSEAPAPAFSLEGLIRDERGVRVAPEAED